jgi:hypothetical protein
MPGATLSEAYETTPLEAGKENPQYYQQSVGVYQHKKEARHILGLVGGNEVSGIEGNRADLESDLLGITRPITWGNTREHVPDSKNSNIIERKNAKYDLSINVKPVHINTYQMWAYPATFAPVPFKQETCMKPEKF